MSKTCIDCGFVRVYVRLHGTGGRDMQVPCSCLILSILPVSVSLALSMTLLVFSVFLLH